MNFGAGIALPLGADIKHEPVLMKITVMKDYLLAETVIDNEDQNPTEEKQKTSQDGGKSATVHNQHYKAYDP